MRSFEELAEGLGDDLGELIAQLRQARGRGDDSSHTADGLDLAGRLRRWLKSAEEGEEGDVYDRPLRYTCALCGHEGDITGERLGEYLATEFRPEITCEGCRTKIILSPTPPFPLSPEPN